MDKKITLKAQIRNNNSNVQDKKQVNSYIPAVIYGRNIKNQNLLINENDFNHIYSIAGESNLINLEINNKPPVKVLVKDVQKNPIKDNFIHIDFYKVDMNKKITAEIPLNFIGESKAVKELGGMLVRNMDVIEIECMPNDLVNNINVDLSTLNLLNDVIYISDLKLSDGLKMISEINKVIISVVEPIKEEEAAEEEKAEDK